LARNNLKQLRIAETEKYAHVTYFFNGGQENIFPNEQRILISSPKVDTYDLKPEMSSFEVTDALLDKMADCDFFVLNFANPDMVGHTGNLSATTKAIQAVDHNLGRIIEKGKQLGYTFIIIADHGNAEEVDVDDPSTLTAHSTNPVPFILVDFYNKLNGVQLRDKGILADIAPTILDILDISKPKEMTGRSMILNKNINQFNNKTYFIKQIEADTILDSRNKPTLRARIIIDNNIIGD
jgi:2,3-bisphosphoglycerate-independent phosphoglycerate mutase